MLLESDYFTNCFRVKLEDIAKMGKEAWLEDCNFQGEGSCVWGEDLVSDLSDNVMEEEQNPDTWAGKFLKLSRSPTFGSFFGS